MSYIVKTRNKKSGTVYVYAAEAYRNADGQPRSRRRLIGKLDEETGEVVPTGRRGPHRKHDAPTGYAEETPAVDEDARQALIDATNRCRELEKELSDKKEQISSLTWQVRKLRSLLESLGVQIQQGLERCGEPGK